MQLPFSPAQWECCGLTCELGKEEKMTQLLASSLGSCSPNKHLSSSSLGTLKETLWGLRHWPWLAALSGHSVLRLFPAPC
jgi:hypothetical protein